MKKIFSICSLLFLCSTIHAQDFTFSQFYEKPLLRNPSLAGVFDGDLRVTGIYRNQWQSVTVPYNTSGASVEVKFPVGKGNDYLTVAMQMTNDVAGDIKLKRTQILPVINFHKSLNDEYNSYLSLAFMAGNVSSRFDPSKLQLNDQFINGVFNPSNPTMQSFSKTSINYWDLGAGLTYSKDLGESTSFYIGASLFHLNKPKVAFYTNNANSTTLKNKLSINAGLTTPTSDYNRLLFYADYFIQSGNKQFLGGLLYGFDLLQHYESEDKISIYTGAFYRWGDALIPVVKLNYYKLALGISYDINVSKLTTASQARGGFEVSASYRTQLNIRNSGAEKMRCVKFTL